MLPTGGAVGGAECPSHAAPSTAPGRRTADVGVVSVISAINLSAALAKRLQEALHDRMLLLAELVREDLAHPADDGERGQLRLCGEPALDREDVRIQPIEMRAQLIKLVGHCRQHYDW